MSKARSSKSKGTKGDGGDSRANSRLESSRSIAEKSIARMVQSSVSQLNQPVSSTPTGLQNIHLSMDEAEQWPGPFSTAAAMIKNGKR